MNKVISRIKGGLGNQLSAMPLRVAWPWSKRRTGYRRCDRLCARSQVPLSVQVGSFHHPGPQGDVGRAIGAF